MDTVPVLVMNQAPEGAVPVIMVLVVVEGVGLLAEAQHLLLVLFV